ncbi:MAG: InlB B-repeat-containing protein [Clostridiales bacterium]|nr:InlB B-repeat-containing protein [Clostridiales bacterium]
MFILKKTRRTLCALLAALLCAAALPFGVLSRAVSFAGNLDDPDCSAWRPIGGGTIFDIEADAQTGGSSVSQDIVGNAEYPPAYMQFSESGDAIAVRIRVDGTDSPAPNLQFKRFAHVGIDVDGDGAMDFYMGTYNPTGNSGRMGIYLADPALANTGPSNAGVTKPIASYQPRAGENYSFIEVGVGSNGFSGNEDYFISFVFTLEDINAALIKAGKPELCLTPTTSFYFCAGTAMQDNTLNADICGMDGIENGPWPNIPPISTDGAEYFIVTYDNSIGDSEAAPRTIPFKEDVQTKQATADRYPATNPKKRVTADGKSWTFEGWSTTNPYDENGDFIGPVTPFTVPAAIGANITVYAVWQSHDSEQVVEDLVVHFNPGGGTWTGSDIQDGHNNYWHIESDDGIIPFMPPNPGTAGLPSLTGQNIYVFGGWVTTFQVYGKGSNPNIVVLSDGSTGAIGELNFHIWSNLVSELMTPNQAGIASLAGHGDEPTVYALWLVVQGNKIPYKINFYDNIYTGTPVAPVYGTLLYAIFGANGGKTNYSPMAPTRQGYAFRGWDTNPNGTGTRYEDPYNGASALITTISLSADMNLYAIWEPAQYALQFLPNSVDMNGNALIGLPQGSFGGILCPPATDGIKYPAFPAAPMLAGYTFKGWNTDSDAFGYWVNYDAQSAAYSGENITPGGNLRYSLLDYAVPENLLPGTVPEAYNRLYAIWEKDVTSGDEYSVVFYANGYEADELTPETGGLFTDGVSLTLAIPVVDNHVPGAHYATFAPPTKEGYVFVGWSYQSDPKRAAAFFHPAASELIFLGQTNVYAVWTPIPDIYTVAFHPNSGAWPEENPDYIAELPNGLNGPIEVETDYFGMVVYVPYSANPTGPVKEDFVFMGWNLAPDGSGAVFLSDTEVTAYTQYLVSDPNDAGKKLLPVYAQWQSALVGTVLVVFYRNDGSTGNGAYYIDLTHYTEQYTPWPAGTTIQEPLNPDNGKGWTFAGWYKDAACTTGQAWNFGNDLAGRDPTNLYAKWLVDLVFDWNCGTPNIYHSATVQYGAAYAEPTPPTRQVATFLGWYADAACTIPWDFEAPRLAPATVYAAWDEPEPHEHDFVWDSEEPATCTEGGWNIWVCECGEEQREPTDPLGHDWGEWYEVYPPEDVERRDCLREDCEAYETRPLLPAHEHDYTEIMIHATCTEEGRVTTACECGDAAMEILPALGHDWGAWYEMIAPQIGIPGEERRECLRGFCDAFEIRPIDPLPPLPAISVTTLGAQAKTDASALRYGASLRLSELQALLKPGDILIFGFYDMMLTTYTNGLLHLTTGTDALRRVVCSDGTNNNSGRSITWTEELDTAKDAQAWLDALRAGGRTDVKIFSVHGDIIEYCVMLDNAPTSMQSAFVAFMPFVEALLLGENSTYLPLSEDGILGIMKYNSINNILFAEIKRSRNLSYPYDPASPYNE